MIGVVVAVLAVAIVVWVRGGRDDDPAARPGSEQVSAERDAPVARTPTAEPRATDEEPHPAKHVRRLDAEQRRRLGERITAARERARAGSSANRPAGTHTTDDTIELAQVSSSVKTALEEAIPILAECYTAGSGVAPATAAVTMTMFSDPTVGTVIDTDAMKDRDGKPLAPALDDCLRTTIESLELPPLEVGGRLPLQYSFVFD